MNPYLLDVSILIPLIDPRHINHDLIFLWFSRFGEREWLTCPITENGAVRIVSGPRYQAEPVTPGHATASLRTLTGKGNHRFVGDTISVTDRDHLDADLVRTSRRLTDAYLVALAAAHGATFVTMDGRLNVEGVVVPEAKVLLLESGLDTGNADGS